MLEHRKQTTLGLQLKKKLHSYLFILHIISFFSIRISGYNVRSSDSLFFSVVLIIQKAIFNNDLFLLEIALLILGEVLCYCIFIRLKWNRMASISLFLLWFFLYLSFKGFFDSNVFLASSIPFLLVTFFMLKMKVKIHKTD